MLMIYMKQLIKVNFKQESKAMDTQEKKLRVIVYGKQGTGKTTLCHIIKNCLERDYSFRTLFADYKISLEEVLEEENQTKTEINTIPKK